MSVTLAGRDFGPLVLSHTLGVVYCRYLLGLEPLTSMSTDTLAAALGNAIQDHLTRPLPS